MHTQVNGAKMMRWAVIVGTSLFMTVFLVPISQAADEVAARVVYHTQKAETMEVGDVPGHILGVVQHTGLGFITKGPESGQTTTRMSTTYIDTVKGKGTTTSYLVYTYSDGSTQSLKASGTITSVDGGKRSAFEGTYEVTGGTGKFEGMKGKGTFKGERLGSLQAGADSYVDTTGTQWK
jgi:hypothetical protein